jgi:hypothetical protein
MNQQELILSYQQGIRRRTRLVLGSVLFVLIWMAGLFYAGSVLDDTDIEVFVAAAAVPIVVFIAVAVRVVYLVPKCPHCGVRLMGWLFPVAMASGRCGSCGKSMIDEHH